MEINLGPYLTGLIVTGAVYSIACMGLYVTLASGQFSMIHATIMGLGAYGAGVCAVNFGLGFWAALAVAAVVGCIVGGLVGALMIRSQGMLLALGTLALGEALSLIISNISYLGGAIGIEGVPLRTTLGPVLLVLGIVLAALIYLRRTRLGLAVVALGKDATVAEALGVGVTRLRVGTFAVGGAIAGVAGGLYVQQVGVVQPSDLAFAAEVTLWLYVIIGGIGTPWGALLGAGVITELLQILQFSPLDRYWILGLLLVVVVTLRPEGILRRRRLAILGPSGAGTVGSGHPGVRGVASELRLEVRKRVARATRGRHGL